ncbi:cytochrome protein [Penicillium canescens]|nr:cytochrome protein [Penicillium canescens]KAJ6181525.1 cytochrome protein [Penicillium canescens]
MTEAYESPDPVYILGLGSLIILAITLLFNSRPSKIPIINKRKWYEFGTEKAVHRFNTNAADLIKDGITKSAFYLFADNKYRMILGPKYANIIRNDTRMSFRWWIFDELHGNLPGFEPFKELAHTGIINDMIKTKMSHSLDALTGPVASETVAVLKTICTDEQDWHKLKLKQAIAAIVAQVTGRAFLGHDFCREPAWRDDIVRWSHQMITAARELHTWPKFLRPIVVWMLPSCKRLRETVEVARRNLEPVIKERHAIIAARKENGETSETGSCALDWLEEVAQGRQYDPIAMQICLAFVGMDTTADLVFHVISDLSQDQELVNALREEIKSNLDGKRFTKQELQNLKLLDSVIKESQRLRPTGKVSMHRIANETLTLPGDIHVPKGTYLGISTTHMMDSSVWPDGEKFDGYRFFNLRQNPDKANTALLVSTSPDHLGFGYGKMACPGRFFVANELKVILCHFLMMYDFQITEPYEEHSGLYGYMTSPSSETEITLRRRNPSSCEAW